MLKNIFQIPNNPDILTSQLYDQNTFYRAFDKDIATCRETLVIESPFITTARVSMLLPTLKKLRKRNVRIVVNTRNPEEHDGIYEIQAEHAVSEMQDLGIKVLYTTKHHRKIAIIDGSIVWEGSLNILSYNDSCEIMRRTRSPIIAQQMTSFIKIAPHLVQ